ncbi:MAG: glutamine synthetase family protein [Candidatus Dormibacteraeota bacterium]|nr:glutamine synthetase family protein [Candidatus Dormibacteraeota bacterium]
MATTVRETTRAVDPEVRRAEVLTRAETAGLRLVRFLYCDNDGIIRGKSTSVSTLKDRLETGIGLTLAMQAFTMLDHLAAVDGMGPVGEIRLVPDPATFVVAPYAPHTGVALVDMVTLEGKPYEADGRAFLKRMIERATEHDLSIVAAFEPEWSLARRDGEAFVPLDDSGCFTTYGMNKSADVIDEIVAALESQGLTVEQYYAELGWGQQELSIRHAPALTAADNQLIYRETVRGIALRHGLYASFAPKPWGDQAGNGCHLHFSGWDPEGTVNRFHDAEKPYSLSDLGRQFMAGILEHLPALVALTCASVNSYRRLQPQMWASAYRAWGPDNREGALRLASTFRGHEADSLNVELKSSDASANPYIALGGVIAAGLDGIERGLTLAPPVTVDPHTLDERQRKAIGADRLPQSLREAVGNLKQDRVLTETLGERLATSYIAVKELDIEAFAQQDDAFEFRQHIYKY